MGINFKINEDAASAEAPPAVDSHAMFSVAERATCNWNITEKDGAYTFINNVTNRKLECTMQEFNDLMRVNNS